MPTPTKIDNANKLRMYRSRDEYEEILVMLNTSDHTGVRQYFSNGEGQDLDVNNFKYELGHGESVKIEHVGSLLTYALTHRADSRTIEKLVKHSNVDLSIKSYGKSVFNLALARDRVSKKILAAMLSKFANTKIDHEEINLDTMKSEKDIYKFLQERKIKPESQKSDTSSAAASTTITANKATPTLKFTKDITTKAKSDVVNIDTTDNAAAAALLAFNDAQPNKKVCLGLEQLNSNTVQAPTFDGFINTQKVCLEQFNSNTVQAPTLNGYIDIDTQVAGYKEKIQQLTNLKSIRNQTLQKLASELETAILKDINILSTANHIQSIITDHARSTQEIARLIVQIRQAVAIFDKPFIDICVQFKDLFPQSFFATIKNHAKSFISLAHISATWDESINILKSVLDGGIQYNQQYSPSQSPSSSSSSSSSQLHPSATSFININVLPKINAGLMPQVTASLNNPLNTEMLPGFGARQYQPTLFSTTRPIQLRASQDISAQGVEQKGYSNLNLNPYG